MFRSLLGWLGSTLCAAMLLGVPVLASDTVETARTETIRRQETIAPGSVVRVFNGFGSITARFGGYEHRVELVATVQRLDPDAPPLELHTETTDAGIEINVAPSGEPLPYGEPGRRDRVDLVVFVPLGCELELETVDDGIEVKGVKSEVTATSRTGEIRLRSVEGPIRAKTERGKILAILEYEATELPLELTTVTGEIEIHVWEDARLNVDLATSGEISTDFSMTVEHRRLEEPSKYASAVLGGGGPLLTVRSKRGRVRLLRLTR